MKAIGRMRKRTKATALGRKNRNDDASNEWLNIKVRHKKAVPFFVSDDFDERKIEEYFRVVRITNQVVKTNWMIDKRNEERIIKAECKKKVGQAKNFLLTKVVTSIN